MVLSVAIVVFLPCMMIYLAIKGIIELFSNNTSSSSYTNTTSKPNYRYTFHSETPDEENARTDYWGLDDEWGVFK